ncbi:hypothetical protein SLEP1_g23107 [Rubroshorea leprosula]|uniref:Uncharacterized protein n=1 Tax=Rubroshorea leprosula TaxID=152421 RepID=A0AAV5JBB9_9ROSI|nr:hypothetical protein SLEP1_g23107 [Rubroshorea leprosula]
MAEGAIQPLYLQCCGNSAPVQETLANQPFYYMKSANHPFCTGAELHLLPLVIVTNKE